MPKAQVTTNEILDAVNNFSNVVEKRFVQIDERFNDFEAKMDARFDEVDKRFKGIEFRLDHDMATKKDLAALEERMNKKFADQANTMDAIAKTVKATSEEVSAWHGRSDRTEKQVATHEKRLSTIQAHFGLKFE